MKAKKRSERRNRKGFYEKIRKCYKLSVTKNDTNDQMLFLFLKSFHNKPIFDSILPSSRNIPAVIKPVNNSEVGEWIILSPFNSSMKNANNISDQAIILSAMSKYLFILNHPVNLSNTIAEETPITNAMNTLSNNPTLTNKLSTLATIKKTTNPVTKSLFSFDSNATTSKTYANNSHIKLSLNPFPSRTNRLIKLPQSFRKKICEEQKNLREISENNSKKVQYKNIFRKQRNSFAYNMKKGG